MKTFILIFVLVLSVVGFAQNSKSFDELRKARSLYFQKNFDSASNQYDLAFKNIKTIDSLPEQFQSKYRNGEYEKAISYYMNLNLKRKLTSQEKFNLGNAYLLKGDLEKSIRQYIDLLKENPKNSKASHNLSIALRQKKKAESLDKKMANTEEKLQKLAQKQDDLSQNQEGKSNETQKEEQEKINEDFQEIKKEIKDINTRNKENKSEYDLSEAEKKADDINDDLQNSSEYLTEKNEQKASKSQDSASDGMRELAEYLNNAKNKKEDKSKASQFQSSKEKEELKKGMNDRMLQNIADKEAETKRKLNSINQESEGSQRKFTKRW